MQEISAIHDYHVHVYYDAATRDLAAQLRQAVEERFAGQMRMGSWHDVPVGPHVQAMYQIAFAPPLFPTLVPFLMMNRMGLTILVHPESGTPARRPHAERDVDGSGAAGQDRGPARGRLIQPPAHRPQASGRSPAAGAQPAASQMREAKSGCSATTRPPLAKFARSPVSR